MRGKKQQHTKTRKMHEHKICSEATQFWLSRKLQVEPHFSETQEVVKTIDKIIL